MAKSFFLSQILNRDFTSLKRLVTGGLTRIVRLGVPDKIIILTEEGVERRDMLKDVKLQFAGPIKQVKRRKSPTSVILNKQVYIITLQSKLEKKIKMDPTALLILNMTKVKSTG